MLKKDSISKPVLFSYFNSSSSWRVRVVLEYKQIDYQMVNVNLVEKEHLSEEYSIINPC